MQSSKVGPTETSYVLASYGEYGFEDGNFIKVCGSGVIPTVIMFSLDIDRTYSLVKY